MSYWFERMAERKDLKYPEQMAYLQEEHGFSRAHANAIVLYCKGNTSSKRFDTIDQYLKPCDPTAQETVRAILSVIAKKYPKSEAVIAWNHPLVRLEGKYLFGVDVLKKYLLISPLSADIIEEFTPVLEGKGLGVNKKTIQVPLDWKVDAKLIRDMVAARIVELEL